jgi:hypothetical protein
VPEQVPLTAAGIAPYLAGIWPAGAQAGPVQDGEERLVANALVAGADAQSGRELIATIHKQDRRLTIEEWRRLPTGLPTDADSLTRFLAGQVQGEVDLKGREDDDTSLKLDCDSVWGMHSVQVDKKTRRWQVATTPAHTAVAFIDLHRGKHAGGVQKLLVDATALLLGFVTLSGVAMGLGAAAHRRRLAAAVLAGGSLLLLTVLLIAR